MIRKTIQENKCVHYCHLLEGKVLIPEQVAEINRLRPAHLHVVERYYTVGVRHVFRGQVATLDHFDREAA